MAAIAQWLVHLVVVQAMRVRSPLVAPEENLPVKWEALFFLRMAIGKT